MSESKTTKRVEEINKKVESTLENNASDDHLVVREIQTETGTEAQIVGNASLVGNVLEDREVPTEYKFDLVKGKDEMEDSIEGSVDAFLNDGWVESKTPGLYIKTLVAPVKVMPVALASQVQSLIMPLMAVAFNMYRDDSVGKSVKVNSEFISQFIGEYGGVLRKLASILTGYDQEVFLDWLINDLQGPNGNGGFQFLLDVVSTQPNLVLKVNL
jgi:hypothetical protein